MELLAPNGQDLISQGVVELKMFDTKPEHAKEYGFVFPSSEIYDGLSAV